MEILERYTLFDSVLPTTTGIYFIHNTLNDKVYIGSASVDDKIPSKCGFRGRFDTHRRKLIAGKHHSKQLQNAYNAYLKADIDPNDVFQILIVEYVPSGECIDVEQMYLDAYQHFYNSQPIAASPKGFKASEETKKKMSDSQKGRVFSDEHRKKLSKAQSGKKHTKETLDKLSSIRKGVIPQHLLQTYIGIAPDGTEYIFTNGTEFARQHGLRRNHICNCAAGRHKTHLGWKFSYYNQEAS